MCAIPQFLQYVIPFATLSSSSMVLGDLGANNELLALRSLGIPMKKVYKALVILSLILTVITFFISISDLITSTKFLPWISGIFLICE